MGGNARGSKTLAALVACAIALLCAASADARMTPPRIQVLSNRADLVSGGDALVRVTLPKKVKASRLKLTVGKRNVTRSVTKVSARQLEGEIDRLPNGRVALTARIRRGSAARLYVTNHPIGGPVLLGAHDAPRARG